MSSCMYLTSGEQSNELLYVGFNQDNGCFACGTDNGFRIYNVDPFRESFRKVFSDGGIGIVEMLYRCNLLALVGGGRNPKYPTNKVMIWDDHVNRCIGELMFKSEVRAVKLRRDRVIVVLLQKVYVYRFSDLKLLDQITTLANPKGLISLCPDASHSVLACPGLQKGSIRVELYDINKAMLIKAHDSELAQIALNMDGSRIASASDKGTLIRIWDCHTGELLRELRRGMDRAEIYCICFNPASTFVACSSDKGTVHIFSLTDSVQNGSGPGAGEAALPPPPPMQAAPGLAAGTSGSSGMGGFAPSDASKAAGSEGAVSDASNARSGLSFIRDLLPASIVPKYLVSEWSYAQVRGLEGKAICAFDRDSARIIHGGECERLTYAKFVKSEAEAEAAAAVQPWTAGGSTGALMPAQYAAAQAQGGAGVGGSLPAPLDGAAGGINGGGNFSGGAGTSNGFSGDVMASSGIGTTGGVNGGSSMNSRGLSFAPDDDGR